MSRESDKLMMKLPLADVAAWLQAELQDAVQLRDDGQRLCEHMTGDETARCIARLIAKLGQDEDTKGEDDAE